MSEFVGLLALGAAPLPEGCADRLHRALAWVEAEPARVWSDGVFAIAHRQRLVTPEDRFECQPLMGPGDRHCLALDGRIDNRDDVAARLGMSSGRDIPDGRMLLEAWTRWEDAALPTLVGDFAGAVWDGSRRHLHLFRDQLGHRTLFYYQGRDFFAFANTIQNLLNLDVVPRAIDEQTLADYLIDNHADPHRSFWKNIVRLPSASVVRVDTNGQIDSSIYWRLDPERRVHYRQERDYIDEARALLDQAVRCRLRSIAPVASTMTGGLDSSAVATTAAKLQAPEKFMAFTTLSHPDAWTPGPGEDERSLVAAIAAHTPGIDSRIITPSMPERIETDPERWFLMTGMPIRNAINIAWFAQMFRQVRGAGVGVLLTGQTGNYSLSWDGLRSLRDLLGAGAVWRFGCELDKTARFLGRSRRALFRAQVLTPSLPGWVRAARERLRQTPPSWGHSSAINPVFADEMNVMARWRSLVSPSHYQLSGDGRGIRIALLKFHERQQDLFAGLRRVNGFETRRPLADIRLLEFCLAIPQEMFLKDGQTRRLARLTLADRLPGAVLANPRIMRQCPEWAERITSRKDQLIADAERLSQSPTASRILDVPRLQSLAQSLDAGRALPEHHFVLSRGLHVGRFIGWAEGSNH